MTRRFSLLAAVLLSLSLSPLAAAPAPAPASSEIMADLPAHKSLGLVHDEGESLARGYSAQGAFLEMTMAAP